MRILIRSRYLEDSEDTLVELGSVGVGFMARRLTHTQRPVCPHWGSIRDICRRLAEEDCNDQANYGEYVILVCSYIKLRDGVTMRKLCDPEYKVCGCGRSCCSCGRSSFGSDMITAAIYTNKLSVVDDFSNVRDNLNLSSSVLGSPFRAAVKVNSHSAVDMLFAKCRHLGVSRPIGNDILPSVYKQGDLSMIEKFIPWVLNFDPMWEDSEAMARYRATLIEEMLAKTPSVEVFEVFTALKKQTDTQDFYHHGLGQYMWRACYYGWEAKVKHLLSLRAPVNGSYSGRFPLDSALAAACKRGHTSIVRLLLEQGVKILEETLGEAAKSKRWDMVWMLVDDYGADVNTGVTPVIVHAIEQERKDLFIEFLKRVHL
jgi:hypothetical protein